MNSKINFTLGGSFSHSGDIAMKLSPNTWAWIAVIICVLLSTTVDALGTLWWKRQSWMLAVVVIALSPLVFFAFGYVGNRFGLSIASSLTNSLIVIGPILVGLVLFSEWKKMSAPIYIGLLLIVIGITVVALYKQD